MLSSQTLLLHGTIPDTGLATIRSVATIISSNITLSRPRFPEPKDLKNRLSFTDLIVVIVVVAVWTIFFLFFFFFSQASRRR
jgi:heme/copper-type cytochrome/quinol oxidase subunit 2